MSKMPKLRPFLLSLPERLQIVVIVGVTVIAAFAVAIATRALFDFPRLVADTQLTTAVYGVLGTIYAVLLAFTISGVWQNFNRAAATVQTEADALSGLVHIIDAFPADQPQIIRSLIFSYAQLVLAEWEALAVVARRQGLAQDLSLEVTALINSIQALKPINARETAVFGQALVMLNAWLDARRNRLQSANGGYAEALWPLLIGGSLVLFAFHGLIVAKSLEVWGALLLGLSLVVGLSFYLIFSLDSPFTGSLSAHAGPFQWLLYWVKREESSPPGGPESS